MNRKYLIVLIIIVIIIAIGAFIFANINTTTGTSINIDKNTLESMGNLVVNNTEEIKEKGLFSSENSDLNTVLVTNNGKLNLKNSIINKTGDTQSNGDDTDFYGINSGILVNNNSTLDISNVEIITNSKGSNAIFVTNSIGSSNNEQTNSLSQKPEQNNNGENQPPETNGGSDSESIGGSTEATISNVKITTYQDKSRGLDATYGGKITANNVEINTNGGSCAALATDRGEGEVHVENSILNTGVSKESGKGSPLIYSTGNITAKDSEGTAYVSQIACIEGKNSITLEDCDFTCYGEGNREDNGEYVDLGGIFIYQSMSGDADVGTSVFTAKNTEFDIAEESNYYKTAPMFHITNTACVINLEDNEFDFGSGIFLDDSSQNQWGNEESNGGDVELNTNNEEIDGDIIVDSISKLKFNMKNTEFNGAIKSTGNTTVVLGEGSTWTLTGDSSISNLEITGNINYGDYTLTINGVEYTNSNPYKR